MSEAFPKALWDEIQEYSTPQLTAEEVAAEEFASEQQLAKRRENLLVSAATMAKKLYPKQSFLIGPKLFPKGGKMLITAENGTGKSALVTYIAACLATGKPMFDMYYKLKGSANYGEPIFPVHGNSYVMVVDYEIPEHIRQGLRLAPLRENFEGDFLGNLAYAKHPSNYRLENERNSQPNLGSFDKFLQLVAETKPDVLIIDPFSSTHSLDENSNMIKQALNNIDKMVDYTGTSVILVHHASTKLLRDNKGMEIEKNAKEKARGHSAITDWPDVHLQINALKSSQIAVKHLEIDFGKTRYCEKPNPIVITADIQNMSFTG